MVALPKPLMRGNTVARTPDGDGSAPTTGFKFEPLEDEVKSANERDALMAKANAKLRELTAAPDDRINR